MGADVIKKMNYSHDAMVDMIIANPAVKQKELAEMFGRTQGWISQVVNSDAFREKLALRKGEVVDPVLLMTLEERIRGMVDSSLQLITEKLEDARAQPGLMGMNQAIRAFEHGSRALGYGAKAAQEVNVTTYVAVVPQKSLNAEAWVEAHSPRALEVQDTGRVLDGIRADALREKRNAAGSD